MTKAKSNLKTKRRKRRTLGGRSRQRLGTDRPRLSVHRTLKHISAQVIDDGEGRTLAAVSSTSKALADSLNGKNKTERATVIGAEIARLAKEAGVGEKVAAITEQAMRGEIDFTESFARRVGLLEGLDEGVLADVAKRLKMTEGAERLISTLKSLGYKTAILSGGFTYFAKGLQDKLGIDYIYANELEIKNGKVTGQVTGQVVDGQRKAALLDELAAKEKIGRQQVIAVGDGANDLPMLSRAGLGVAFRAKPLVKESAKHAISNLGLDAVLYLIGFRDREAD